MTAVRVLVVDDEKPARERVRRLLARDDRVTVAGCCAGGAEALDALRAAANRGEPVQVLCLDVQMPELDGFGVIARLVADPVLQMPAVVFVTAHDAFAVRAFESQAVDYLLKPFSDERFQVALDRAIRTVRTRGAVELLADMEALLGRASGAAGPASRAGQPTRQPVDRIVLRGDHRVRLLPVEQITWIEAEGMYVRIHTREGRSHLHRALMGSLESTLDPRQFVRIHRSAIVNIDLVAELRQDAHGDYVAVLRGGTEVRVGRRFRERLQARLGQPL
jgi:two-component system LytT family response regulator